MIIIIKLKIIVITMLSIAVVSGTYKVLYLLDEPDFSAKVFRL